MNIGEIGKQQTISSFWTDLQYLTDDNYSWERRENSIENEKTYMIYWNTNVEISDKTDSLYCLQKINIYLKKVVETDKITYKVYRIILTDN